MLLNCAIVLCPFSLTLIPGATRRRGLPAEPPSRLYGPCSRRRRRLGFPLVVSFRVMALKAHALFLAALASGCQVSRRPSLLRRRRCKLQARPCRSLKSHPVSRQRCARTQRAALAPPRLPPREAPRGACLHASVRAWWRRRPLQRARRVQRVMRLMSQCELKRSKRGSLRHSRAIWTSRHTSTSAARYLQTAHASATSRSHM